ncbi:MAG TPA: hypothetical protein VGD21_01620 [Lysobacter sp.]
MLDRIEMDVVEVMPEIRVVSDQVLPIPPLPKAAFALTPPAAGAPFRRRHGARKT